jgi:hypothetical protein
MLCDRRVALWRQGLALSWMSSSNTSAAAATNKQTTVGAKRK